MALSATTIVNADPYLPFANGNFNQTFSPGNNTSPAGDAVNLRNVGNFGGADKIFGADITIPTTNPFNTTGEVLIQQGGWGGEFGHWIQDTWIRTLRNTVGAVAQLPHNWIVEGSFTYGESDATETLYHAISLIPMQEALNGTLPGHVGHFFNPFLDNRVSGNFNKEFYSAISTD